MTFHERVRDVFAVDVAVSERRCFPRFVVALTGVCSIAGGPDVACTAIDLSIGGAALRTHAAGARGERVVLLLPQIGLIEAILVRQVAGGFAVAFEAGRVPRRRIAGYLDFILGQQPTQASRTGSSVGSCL